MQTKPLTVQQRKWELQREIFSMIVDDGALKRQNWKRYVAWLKLNHIDIRKKEKKIENRWKREGKGELKYIKPIESKIAFGIFTNHLDEEALWYLLSVVKDRINRNESPTTYVLSLVKNI